MRLLGALVAAALLAPAPVAAGTLGLLRADGGDATADDRIAAAVGVAVEDLVPATWPAAEGPWVHVRTAVLQHCAGEASDLAGVVTAARAQLDDLDAGAAQAALSEALQTLPCATTFLDRGLLLESLELFGQAAQDQADEANAREGYESLLTFDPAYALTSAPGTGYEVLWEDVRREVLARGTVDVAVPHASADLRVDGTAVPASAPAPLRLVPGRHLLQWAEAEAVQTAWLLIPGDDDPVDDGAPWPRVAMQEAAVAPLLQAGPVDLGRQTALRGLLGRLAEARGWDGVVIVQSDAPLSGYLAREGELTSWAAAPQEVPRLGTGPFVAAAQTPFGVRLGLGGGWLLTSGASYAELSVAADVRLVGPLHARVDVGVGFSQPLRLPGSALDGKIAILPGFGGGLLVRPAKGLVQPFGAVTAGVWIAPASYTQPAVVEAAAIGASADDVIALERRGATTFRLFVDGGVDLLPGDGAFFARLSGGIGYGFGFQARAGVQVGFRVGR